ncbi:MAG: NAD(P)H-dependent oxidoreductase [Bdellovibrionales bacterium]|nr:NAD(P)H-dependent oxidoreductase [Bdellovibrionales bacterium]
MITIISGTNRPQAQTLRVAKIYEGLFKREGAETTFLSLADLPATLFTPQAYAEKPKEFAPFNDAVLKSDGLFVVTPEYNGGFPGVLKYFIDMLKFPESFENRPVAFCGVAAGMFGALRPVEQLSQIFTYRNAFVFNERIFLPRVETQLNEKNEFTDPLTNKLVHQQVKNFVRFCKTTKS